MSAVNSDPLPQNRPNLKDPWNRLSLSRLEQKHNWTWMSFFFLFFSFSICTTLIYMTFYNKQGLETSNIWTAMTAHLAGGEKIEREPSFSKCWTCLEWKGMVRVESQAWGWHLDGFLHCLGTECRVRLQCMFLKSLRLVVLKHVICDMTLTLNCFFISDLYIILL